MFSLFSLSALRIASGRRWALSWYPFLFPISFSCFPSSLHRHYLTVFSSFSLPLLAFLGVPVVYREVTLGAGPGTVWGFVSSNLAAGCMHLFRKKPHLCAKHIHTHIYKQSHHVCHQVCWYGLWNISLTLLCTVRTQMRGMLIMHSVSLSCRPWLGSKKGRGQSQPSLNLSSSSSSSSPMLL